MLGHLGKGSAYHSGVWRPVLVLVALFAAGCSQVLPAPPPPTPTPVQPDIRPLPGRGISIEGHGSAQTDDISPDYGGTLSVGIAVVTLTHSGHSSFIVTALQGGQAEVLTRALGPYRGQRPLVVMGDLAFDVTADGDWTVKVQPMSSGGVAPFSGSGDQVSAYFTPPRSSLWSVSHDGPTEFVVYAHCVGGSVLVSEANGPVQEQQQLTFARGPCFWEVRADGAWSLKPAP